MRKITRVRKTGPSQFPPQHSYRDHLRTNPELYQQRKEAAEKRKREQQPTDTLEISPNAEEAQRCKGKKPT